MTDARAITRIEHQVLTGTFFRKRGKSVSFHEGKAPKPAKPVRRPAKVAQMLALAHHLQRGIDNGTLHDRATIARRFQLTRARISQLLDLCLLAPDVQEAVLNLQAVDEAEPLSERALRGVLRAGCWEAQWVAWQRLRVGRQSTSRHPVTPRSTF